MSRVSYVNGRYLPHKRSTVHIEDRGYQFGDGVYEVVLVLNKRLVDFEGHFNRLQRSLNEISLSKASFNDFVLRPLIWRVCIILFSSTSITRMLFFMEIDTSEKKLVL